MNEKCENLAKKERVPNLSLTQYKRHWLHKKNIFSKDIHTH